ncbi:MAG: Amidohydrolase [Candidatus Aerophobetes bacterium ADurb.Bin490]|nr:MAG: Amidohydrolase [Candidatus Aerophobetes bacterium ADurb.Bin490]HNZ30122.1 amidohydrolase family protein [Candidatus Goldiibacteriota bacterium]HPI03288.1 amidohydrolase family protein [Candidatus Goldiibacteriota bacterium]HPN65504.1 amidohydrolase family protein [Candidatus Goldiibacteriota bacterium]HRQ44181.1 amidohydrolase family protein [Candidatus Goldiibacteriota bacterium]
MRIIDTHTHFFTDDRTDADKNYLKKTGMMLDGDDGELEGLKKFMKEDGVSVSVNAPVALSEKACLKVNRMMVEYNKRQKEVICLGTMHPSMGRAAFEEAEFLAQNRVKGVKMHPQIQNFYPDDNNMKDIYEACEKNGLYMLQHAGAGAEPDFDRAKIKGLPESFKNVIQAHPDLKLVIAHMGGLNMWDEAMKFLCGKNVLFDTAYCTVMESNLLSEIVKCHGADKIMFGSDFPWVRAKDIANKLDGCIKDSSEKKMIFYENACKLLGID